VDWHKGVDLADPLGNLTWGDCVPTASLKATQIRVKHALGSQWKPTEEEALDLYRFWAGFDGTAATDRGTDTTVAMQDYVALGIRVNEQLLDCGYWCKINPSNFRDVHLAIAHTGPVQITFALPAGVENATDTWDVTGSGNDWSAGSWGYHRVASGRYDALDGSLVVVSWGQEITVTRQFWQRYCVAVDATISPSTWLDATGMAPPGLDRDALIADAAKLTA
jgi:hypothetical protein